MHKQNYTTSSSKSLDKDVWMRFMKAPSEHINTQF